MSAPLEELLAAARAARQAAAGPCSRFRVGAPVRAGGRIFTGANVENASYGLTLCAERNAVVAAVLAGAGRIDAVAVSCIDALEGSDTTLPMPCGACRQVLAAVADPQTRVVVDGAGSFTLAELLLQAFRLR